MIVVIAEIRSRPDRLQDTLEVLRTLQAASRTETGCISYRYHADIDEPTTIVSVEQWEEQSHVEAHLAGPNVAAALAQAADLVAAAPVITAYAVPEGPRVLS